MLARPREALTTQVGGELDVRVLAQHRAVVGVEQHEVRDRVAVDLERAVSTCDSYS